MNKIIMKQNNKMQKKTLLSSWELKSVFFSSQKIQFIMKLTKNNTDGGER
jgi:hypothetical protein